VCGEWPVSRILAITKTAEYMGKNYSKAYNVKSRRMRWVRHAARMGELRDAYKILSRM
jgi:hypothetical protein